MSRWLAGEDRSDEYSLFIFPFFFFFLIYSFADNEPLVKAITVPEVVLEFVSEFSSKDESYNRIMQNDLNNGLENIYFGNCEIFAIIVR